MNYVLNINHILSQAKTMHSNKKICFCHSPVISYPPYCSFLHVIIMENIESSWNILMDINIKILQSKWFAQISSDLLWRILKLISIIFACACVTLLPRRCSSPKKAPLFGSPWGATGTSPTSSPQPLPAVSWCNGSPLFHPPTPGQSPPPSQWSCGP